MKTLIPGFTKPIEYPSSDGQPMAETVAHLRAMIDLWLRLKAWEGMKGGVYTGGNMLIYYEQGNIARHLAPDGFVVFGVPTHDRDTFRTWAEGAVPSVVFEITSKTTRRDDTETKFAIYQNVWRVDEYILFDPTEEYLSPSLAGFRRGRGGLQPIKLNKDGSLTSRRLGLILERDGERLRLRDSATGETILTADEQRAVESSRRAAKAEAEKDQMAAEIDRLRAENAALKKKK